MSAGAICALGVLSAAAFAQDAAKQLAARVELHLIPSLTLSDDTVRNCRIREDASGRLINTGTGEPFTYKDACVERDPRTNHDPAATQAAKQSVKEFLRAVFKLTPPV